MFKKRGKMGQPVKNGTRYKKCTLVVLGICVWKTVNYFSAAGTYLKILRTKKFCLKLGGDNIQKWDILKAFFQNMVGTCPHVPICSGAPAWQ